MRISLYFLLVVVMAIQACTKITDDVVECQNSLATPSLNDTIFSPALGTTVTVSIVNPQPNLTYTWTGPDSVTRTGEEVNIVALTTAYSGTYKVVASSSAGLCKSEPCYFKININGTLPACGMPNNTFELGGSNTLSINPGYSYEVDGNIGMSFSAGFSRLIIRLGSEPRKGIQTYKVVQYTGNYIKPSEAAIYFELGSSSSYDSYTGNVYTKRDSSTGEVNIRFCDVNMRKYGSSQSYPNTSGNLYCD